MTLMSPLIPQGVPDVFPLRMRLLMVLLIVVVNIQYPHTVVLKQINIIPWSVWANGGIPILEQLQVL